MTRNEAIHTITNGIAALDDARVQALAEMVEALQAKQQKQVRQLSPRELSLLEQSKADFTLGRSYSLEDGFAVLDARLGLSDTDTPST